MRVLLQRVSEAKVSVAGEVVGRVGVGYLLLTGIGPDDDRDTVQKMAQKIVKLRIFPNEQGKFDRSLLDVQGDLLVVSQFTLFGDTRKGNRPSFTQAAAPDHARELCDVFVEAFKSLGVARVETGRFGEHMEVSLTNDGPVTLWLDSESP